MAAVSTGSKRHEPAHEFPPVSVFQTPEIGNRSGRIPTPYFLPRRVKILRTARGIHAGWGPDHRKSPNLKEKPRLA
jgi:hypothetical protein